jgi:hypothetical protein
LPPVYDWEFVRRHPYYVQFYPLAVFYANFVGRELQALISDDFWAKAKAAADILRGLGLCGLYVHPSHDARKVSCLRSHDPPYSNPDASPASYGDLAAKLLKLPRETRKRVASVLAGDGWDTGGQPTDDELAAGLMALSRIPCRELSDPLPELLSISPYASEKGVADAVREVLARLKLRGGVSGHRRLSEAQLDEYLQVWDLREGWAGDHYDWSRTKRFREIAVEIGTPVGTVKNRYRAAFRYITGQDYTPDLFAVLFGPLACHESKWAGWRRSNDDRRPQDRRRPLQTPRYREAMRIKAQSYLTNSQQRAVTQRHGSS